MTESVDLERPFSVLLRILFIIKLKNLNLIYNLEYEPPKK